MEYPNVQIIFTIATILVLILTMVLGWAIFQFITGVGTMFNHQTNPIITGIFSGLIAIATTTSEILLVAFIVGGF